MSSRTRCTCWHRVHGGAFLSARTDTPIRMTTSRTIRSASRHLCARASLSGYGCRSAHSHDCRNNDMLNPFPIPPCVIDCVAPLRELRLEVGKHLPGLAPSHRRQLQEGRCDRRSIRKALDRPLRRHLHRYRTVSPRPQIAGNAVMNHRPTRTRLSPWRRGILPRQMETHLDAPRHIPRATASFAKRSGYRGCASPCVAPGTRREAPSVIVRGLYPTGCPPRTR